MGEGQLIGPLVVRRETGKEHEVMNGGEKSDPAIVAMKRANENGRPGKEWAEPRAGGDGDEEGPHGGRAQPGQFNARDLMA
jgi:hypothetical protein